MCRQLKEFGGYFLLYPWLFTDVATVVNIDDKVTIGRLFYYIITNAVIISISNK